MGADRAPLYEALAEALRADEPVALATIIDGVGKGARLLVRPGREVLGTLGSPELDEVAARDVLGELELGQTCVRHYGAGGEQRMEDLTLFVESFAPQPRMLIFGAVDFTAALVRVAKVLGYKVVVCDARKVFATPKRFPTADEIRVEWPDSVFDAYGGKLRPVDAVCILTHDTKFDVPAVVRALQTDVGYIGVMGSRRTHARRVERLREVGVGEEGLARLMAPIGLDIGGRTPEETAVSIVAEIIAVRAGRAAPSLRDSAGPIHR
ncbi:MAG: XdhC/CoxI family protein [bacterium]|nr:XdhC/CoxI family protein [bacterium]